MHLNKVNQFYLFLFIFVHGFVVQGQNYLVQTETLSIENGLSNRFVRSIVQDTKGFMWFGTKNGLNRYDGYNFKVFTQKNSKLQSDFIDKVYEDVDSNIWIGHALNNESTESFAAIDIININTFKIQSLEDYLGENLPFVVEDVYEIYPSEKGNTLYITTNNGKIYLYKGNKQFELFYEHSEAKTVRAFYKGTLYCWLYCANELVALDEKGNVFQRHKQEIDPLYRCNFVGELSEQSIYLETNDQFHFYETYYWNLEQDSLEIDRPFDFFKEAIDLWTNAAFEYCPEMDFYVHYDRTTVYIFNANKEEIYRRSFVKNKRFVRDLYLDNQGNVWIGVMSKGIVKLSCQKKKFSPYLQDISTRSLIELSGDSILLMNSYEGQYVYNFLTNTSQLLDTLTYLGAKESQDGRFIWLSSSDAYVKKISKEPPFDGQFYYYKYKELRKKNGEFGTELVISWAIHEDLNGKVWIGTVSGLSSIKKGEDSISVFDDYKTCPALRSAIINCLYENEEGLWIATSQGLYVMNLTTGEFQRYSTEMKGAYHLPYNFINHIAEDKQGVFWLSTRGGGLIKLDLKNGITKQFTKENGLSHNVIYAVLEDGDGYLWMSSDYGLMRMNPSNYVINTYLPEDGILHQEFNRKSYYKASNGKLYFGGLSGIVGFDPREFLIEKEQNIPLHIVKYQYFDGTKGSLIDATETLAKDRQIELNHTDRFFTIDLALLDYRARSKRKYAYKIEGLEEEWNYINNNSIRINGLAAGNYTLKVKGEGSNGLWSTEYLSVPILVKQPFYLTWQFFLITGLLFLILILVYSRLRVQRLYRVQMHLEKEVSKRTEKIEQQADELRELDNVKSRFFANISHELRTPLTLMLGPIGAILEKHYGERFEDIESVLKLVKRNGIQLQHLIEEILILSKLEAQSISLDEKEFALLPFLRRVFFAFEAQAQLQEIDWKLNTSIEETVWILLDANKLEKIINNLLSNALKHTPRGGVVLLNVHQKLIEGETFKLVLEVVDSGKGIHPDDLPYLFDRFYQSKQKEAIVQGGTGIGLALTYEFVQLLKGEINVESSLGEGATFSLAIPCTNVEALTLENNDLESEEVVLPILQPKDKDAATILIVEDNDDMRAFLVDVLEPYYNTITAENGRIGLEILEEKNRAVDLILSDVMMPEMDGFELLEKVKNAPSWQQIPMIILTARATEQDKLFALKIGVDDYLQKPFSRQELLVRIYNLLKNYTQRKVWQKEEQVEEETTTNSLEQEDKWMENVALVAKREVGNTQFTITSLAYDLNISERQLRRKIKTKTGLTPNQYFRAIKLDKAREYLEKRRYETVSEVAYKIGFTNVHYFSKIYQEQYGKKPIEYLKG